MRFAEIGLLLVPVFLYIVWHRAISRGERGPSRRLLGATLVLLLGAGLALGLLASHDRIAPGTAYIPAQVQDGVIVPAHGG